MPLAMFSFHVTIHKSVPQILVEDCKKRIDKVERFQEGQRCSEILAEQKVSLHTLCLQVEDLLEGNFPNFWLL